MLAIGMFSLFCGKLQTLENIETEAENGNLGTTAGQLKSK